MLGQYGDGGNSLLLIIGIIGIIGRESGSVIIAIKH